MTTGIRWRVITLQVVIVLVLGFLTGFLFWGTSFANGMVRDQLASQHIAFPSARVLSAPEYPAEIHLYAGQQVVNGDQARVYANDFIAVHLKAMKPYNTYAAASAAAVADPKNAQLQGLVNTLFKGTMLRATLLNAYGWWQVGEYALYAAIGLLVATIGVLGALAFELMQLHRPARHKVILRATA